LHELSVHKARYTQKEDYMTTQKVTITTEIASLKTFWQQRNNKMKSWYQLLLLADALATKGMESYVSNEPQTFYNMAHYLITKGNISHTTPVFSENAAELDRMARISRGCTYMWDSIDRGRKTGGDKSFIEDLAFYLLITGWYSVVLRVEEQTGNLIPQIWSPVDTHPRFANGKLVSCVHSYKVSEQEVYLKAQANQWNYTPINVNNLSTTSNITLDDFFMVDEQGTLWNSVLVDSKDVTGWVDRPDMKILVAPVGGFPDKGSLSGTGDAWKQLAGRSIFEVNAQVVLAFNKWKSQIAQILRDVSQPVTQEFSATPQATPEQLRERGAHFHYAPGELGLQRVPPPALPIELQSNIMEIRREMQKGSFNDAVYGMMEGQQAGYALSLLASSSANQILYPYMDAKHFVLSEADTFWLQSLKRTNTQFIINGSLIEQIQPAVDIPDNVTVTVNSDVATPKDWMERGTIVGMLKGTLDKATIITDILRMNDPQGIRRRIAVDDMLEHPMTKQLELISGYIVHADYLDSRGDTKQAALFRNAASSLEQQMNQLPNGQGQPQDIIPQNNGGTITQNPQLPARVGTPSKTKVNSNLLPPEARGFTPAELRQSIGRGKVRPVPTGTQ
jgi:hypothetical protein